MSQPAVSVVIPTYNQPLMLIESLESVFAQTFTDYEVVVVNDGSTDDTVQQLAPYAGRIRLINQENTGIGLARNRGVDEARGKYIALLDHDDLWMPEKLATQVDFMTRHPQAIGCVSPYSYSNDPENFAVDFSRLAGPDGIIHRPLRWLGLGCSFLLSSAVMLDREKIDGLRYAPERMSLEDIPFYIKMLARGPFGLAGDRILMVYRVHASNYSKQASYFYNGLRKLRAMDARGEFPIPDRDFRRDLSRYLASIARSTAVMQLCSRQRARAAEMFLSEFLPQLRWGRLKFLLTFPALLIAPPAACDLIWPNSSKISEAPAPANRAAA